MTEKEKLNRIREQGKQTREKRKSQVCRVYRVKIDISHLKMLFVEAKWLCNDALTFSHKHDISDYDTAAHTVHGLDKDKLPATHGLEYLGSQMKQAVIQGIKHSIKGLAALKKHNHTVVSLHCKSDYVSINLQQHRAAYRFYDIDHIGLQGFKERIRIKGGETRKYKPEICINMGIKTTITTSDGRKYKVLIEESERTKKCQRLIARCKNCPCCGNLKKDITLADRVYECSCGYRGNRDVHAAKTRYCLQKNIPVGRRE